LSLENKVAPMRNVLVLADGIVGSQIVTWLLENYIHDLGLVVTLNESSLASAVRTAGVETVVYESCEQVKNVVYELKLNIEIGMLLWWPHIVKQPLLDLPVHGFFNMHPSLLPHNRGKHYNFWAIVEGAPFGVTLHTVNADVDAGDIVAQHGIDYGWEDTGGTLFDKAQEATIKLVKEQYPRIRQIDFTRSPQVAGVGSFHRAAEIVAASRIDLDRSYTGRQLLNVLRARTFAGHPACKFTDDGREYEVRVEIKEITGGRP
jgi:methionyl-tRNA formyltransferase